MSVYMDKRIILKDNEQLMNVSLDKLTNNLKCKDLFAILVNVSLKIYN